ncbi:MAG: butyrate kinase [Lachnospiraceae bacterium]|nr:butyrate kinase [Lachnospiraceae bacterium]
MEHILALNPGSTSTKIAVFEGETPLFIETIRHTAEELDGFEHVTDQYEFRKNLVLECLSTHGIALNMLDAVVSRGGLLAPIHAGAYTVNEDMIWQLRCRPQQEHASNVGALIAHAIAEPLGINAYIYDGVTVDELTEINRVTGLPEFHRKGIGHNLNTRAAAMRYAREQGRDYRNITVIVAHLGGGISVNLHHKGRIVDFISDDEGPFSPERAGGLPVFDVIHKCFRDGETDAGMMKLVKRQSGLMAHLGTTDCQEIEARIDRGDEYARLVYDAMALQIAKNIAKCAPVVSGQVDAILITGGIAHSRRITDEITSRVRFLAPVMIYAGEDEMQSLVLGCLRVLRGQEQAQTYVRAEDPIAYRGGTYETT